MAKIIRIAPLGIRVTTKGGKMFDEVEVFALDDEGDVLRYSYKTGT